MADKGDDVISGGYGRGTMYGDVGNDIVIGGSGGDALYDNEGADTFTFVDIMESPVTQPGNKRIIDATVNVAGNNAFTFIGGDFSSITVARLLSTRNRAFTSLLGSSCHRLMTVSRKLKFAHHLQL